MHMRGNSRRLLRRRRTAAAKCCHCCCCCRAATTAAAAACRCRRTCATAQACRRSGQFFSAQLPGWFRPPHSSQRPRSRRCWRATYRSTCLPMERWEASDAGKEAGGACTGTAHLAVGFPGSAGRLASATARSLLATLACVELRYSSTRRPPNTRPTAWSSVHSGASSSAATRSSAGCAAKAAAAAAGA